MCFSGWREGLSSINSSNCVSTLESRSRGRAKMLARAAYESQIGPLVKFIESFGVRGTGKQRGDKRKKARAEKEEQEREIGRS